MKILATDKSSKKTGIAILDDGKFISSHLIDLSDEKNDVSLRIKHMFFAIIDYINEYSPDILVVEAVQHQANLRTTIMLSQLQGAIIGYSYLKSIPISSPLPSEWREILGFTQGPKIKRSELKEQAIDFCKNTFGLTLPEDEAEATCIAYSEHMRLQ